MKACVAYFSRTGCTKYLAQAISNSLQTPIFDIAACVNSAVNSFDLLVLGTPVNGVRPATEVSSFIEQMPKSSGKKAILFCTYKFMKGGTLKVMKESLANKGYTTILEVSKRGVKPNKTDLSGVLDEITKTVREQSV